MTANDNTDYKEGFKQFISTTKNIYKITKLTIPPLALIIALNSCDKILENDKKPSLQKDQVMYSLPNLASKVRSSVFLLEIRDRNSTLIGTGTGFTINEKGWVATNRHVIENAHFVTAKAENGARFEATGIISFDLNYDLVILQLDAKDLPCLKIQEYEREAPKVGERIAVIGSPLGLEGSLSDGIISAIRHDYPRDTSKISYIQITAPISPGSSGSPVFLMNGDVIGIATLTSKEKSQSLNFAVPATCIRSMSAEPNPINFVEFKSIFYERQLISSNDYYSYLSACVSNDYKNANRFASNLAKQFPENPKAHVILSDSLRNLRLYDDAERNALKSLELDSKFHEGYTSLGWAQYCGDKAQQAIKSFHASLKINDQNAVTYEGLARSYSSLRKYQDAEQAIRKQIVISPASSSAWNDLGETLSFIDCTDKSGEAQAAFEKSLILDQRNFYALENLGMLHSTKSLMAIDKQNNRDKAINYLNKAILMADHDIEPEEKARAFDKLGDLYIDKGMLDDAEISFRSAVNCYPENYESLLNLGKLLIIKNKYDDAIKILKKSLDINEKYDHVYHVLGEAYIKNSQPALAIETLKKNRQGYSLPLIGVAYVYLKDYDSAIKALIEGEIKNHDFDRNKVLYWGNVADYLIKYEHKDFCSTLCNRLINLNHGNSVIFYMLGRSMSYKKLYNDSVSAYLKSLELAKKEPDYKYESTDTLCGLAISYYRIGNQEESIQLLDKALKIMLSKIDEDKKEGYAIKCYNSGWNYDILLLEEDLKLNPENTNLSKIIELLQSYSKL